MDWQRRPLGRGSCELANDNHPDLSTKLLAAELARLVERDAGSEEPDALSRAPLRKGRCGGGATLPSFRLSYLLPTSFADACTLAGGAYFLQSGFEQRSCSTHE